MPYAIPYNHPAAIPIGILLVYITLFIMRLITNYATILQPEGTQQADLTILQNTSPTLSVTKGSKGSHELLRSDRKCSESPTVSGGDSANHRPTDTNNLNDTGTNTPSAKNQDSQKYICQEVSQSSNGTTT